MLFMVKAKYGGLRRVARMCQGAAMSRMMRMPLKGRSRFQVRATKSWRVMSR